MIYNFQSDTAIEAGVYRRRSYMNRESISSERAFPFDARGIFGVNSQVDIFFCVGQDEFVSMKNISVLRDFDFCRDRFERSFGIDLPHRRVENHFYSTIRNIIPKNRQLVIESKIDARRAVSVLGRRWFDDDHAFLDRCTNFSIGQNHAISLSGPATSWFLSTQIRQLPADVSLGSSTRYELPSNRMG